LDSRSVVVVGAGLAGTVLGRTLQRRGWSVQIFQHTRPGAATPVAAGLWNPINFFRLIPGWRVEEALPAMLDFFESEERDLGQPFLNHRPYVQPILHQEHKLQWDAAAANYPRWLEANWQGAGDAGLHAYERTWGVLAWGLVREAGWLDVEGYIQACRLRWQSQGRWVDALWTEAEQVERSSVVDARGVFAHSRSEFLARLKPTKGELVEFTLPNGPASVMIKRDLFLQPLGGDRYRAGATFEWQDFSPGSTEKGKAKLQAGLVQLLGEDLSGAYDFEYKAGLRPASHDRRPYVGAHPEGGNRWVFNGFGAKGVLLAPLLASELTAAMEGKGVLNPEADTKRLGPFLSGELEA